MIITNKIFKTVSGYTSGRFFVFTVMLVWSSLWSCQKTKEAVIEEIYEGPTVSIDSVNTEMSDEGKIVVKLQAPKQFNFEDGNREWPKGLSLEYIGEEGEITSTFRADYVYYTIADHLYRGEGNVVVKNIENGDELNTEELFWKPDKEQFYTDRFVTIRSDDEIHTGEGLTANQDFTSYEILKPAGTITLVEE